MGHRNCLCVRGVKSSYIFLRRIALGIVFVSVFGCFHRGFWHQVKINLVIIGAILFIILFPFAHVQLFVLASKQSNVRNPPFTFSANHILPNRNRYSVGSEATYCVMRTLTSTESELETCFGPIHRPAGTRGGLKKLKKFSQVRILSAQRWL